MDIATLGLKVDAGGAILALRNFNTELDKTARSTVATTGAQRLNDTQIRRLVESGAMYSNTLRTSYEAQLRASGQMQRYLEIQKQVDQEMRVADQVARQYQVTQAQTTTTTTNASAGMSRFTSGVSALASQITGVNPLVGRLSGSLAAFAVGGPLTIGVLAGLAAIAAMHKRLGDSARDAKKEVDDLTTSLAAQRRATLAATEAGAAKILMDQRAKLARLGESGPGAVSRLFVGAATGLGIGERAAVEESIRWTKELQEAKDGVRQAEIALQNAEIEGSKRRWAAASESWDLEKSLASDRKRWSDEDIAAGKASLAQLAARVALLGQIKLSILAMESFAGIGQGPIRLPFDPPGRRTGGPTFYDDAAAEAASRRDIEARRKQAEELAQQQRDREAKQFGKLGDAAASVMSR